MNQFLNQLFCYSGGREANYKRIQSSFLSFVPEARDTIRDTAFIPNSLGYAWCVFKRIYQIWNWTLSGMSCWCFVFCIHVSCLFCELVWCNVPALCGQGCSALFWPCKRKVAAFFQESDTKRSSSELCPQGEFILHQHALQNELNDLQQASMWVDW